MTETPGQLAVTLTIDQLKELVRAEMRAEIARLAELSEPEVLDVDGAAKLLGRHPKVVMRYVRERDLPCRFISEREPRFFRSALLAWLNAQPSKPKATEDAA